MNDLHPIPCVLMRGGTSKGPFFLASDLPSDPVQRDALLLEIMGSGHPLQIDGIGGGNAVTSKVAIVSQSSDVRADVDYLFAQVHVLERLVDTAPNCGNMLAAVGPFAIEAGLVQARDGHTLVRIRNLNTGKIIEAKVPTPGGGVTYQGEMRIDGAPGTAAAISLIFVDAAGSKTGHLLPTGAPKEMIEGLPVTCIDCAMPMVLIRAHDLGVAGDEGARDLSVRTELIEALRRIRIEAGLRMGIHAPAERVIPKPVLIAPPRAGGTLAVRYFMPSECHPALATTGAVGIATAIITEGTIAYELVQPAGMPSVVSLEHPSGALDIALERREGSNQPVAGIIRTARRLFEGYVLVRKTVGGFCAA